MTNTVDGTFSASSRRIQIEGLLAQYPHVDREQLADLIHWFRREASAMDVGMLASEPRLAIHYRRLKADHLDRLSGADLVWAAIFVMIIASFFAILIWRTI